MKERQAKVAPWRVLASDLPFPEGPECLLRPRRSSSLWLCHGLKKSKESIVLCSLKKVFAARAVAAFTVLAIADVAFAQGVTLRLSKQLDMAALGAGQPGSVAAYGSNLYVGSLFGGARLYHIQDPLGTPAPAVMFGGINDPATNGGLANAGGSTNGYTNLYTDGVTLVAASENGGETPDVAQSYQVGGTTLNWGGNSGGASMNTQTGTLDGAGVDPVSGLVMTVGFGGDAQNFFNPSSGASTPVAGANILFYSGVGTGWKDVSYDHSTGDLYLRAWGGVARGKRVGGTGQFETLEGGAGVQTIVGLTNNFRSAINVEYLPNIFAGEELVIVNDREASTATFAGKVKAFSAVPPSSGGTASTTPVPLTFVLADGVTPFTTASAGSGIYDFSYDPVSNSLFVSDFSTSQVHVFSAVPEPASFFGVAVAGCGLALALRRRLGKRPY